MREINIGKKRFTKVVCMDEPGAGGACHVYIVDPLAWDGESCSFARVRFQEGPVKENGVNGCHQEDLIAIVIDRLQHFQKGEYACRENALALVKLEEALHWLNHRTDSRIAHGVEGTNQKRPEEE